MNGGIVLAGVRSFIALEIPVEVRAALAAEATRLAQTEADVKWVEARNLHLTLKFLGDVPPERLPKLQQSLSELASGLAPFELTVAGLGAFPSVAEPNVIWAGLSGGARELTNLWRAVEDQCSRLGFARERKPFSPHLTLGRQRSGYRQAVLAESIGTDVAVSFGIVPVTGITLFRSDLRPTGPIYTVQGEYLFGHGKQ